MSNIQKIYTFEEKPQEYSTKTGRQVPVCKTSRYEQSKRKAIEMLNDNKYGLDEADFWILKNEPKDGSTVYYTGLIITHNACLKINSRLPKDKQFRPSCVTVDKNGYGGSLVYTYICDEQGIFEVGEVSPGNCKNAYPNCMALKRLQDRVILKNSSMAEAGIYSENESDDFSKEMPAEQPIQTKDSSNTDNNNTFSGSTSQQKGSNSTIASDQKSTSQPSRKSANIVPGYGKRIGPLRISKEQINEIKRICDEHGLTYKSLCAALNVPSIGDIRAADYNSTLGRLEATPYYNRRIS